ncbi:MAG: hypothetical protein ACREJS_05995 [Candidatus Rokuibacteriota bacterium]
MGVAPRLTRTTSCVLALGAFAALATLDVTAHNAGAGHAVLAGTRSATRDAPRFSVRGKVGGLYPGARKNMKIRIANPNPYPLRLRWLRVRVRNSNVRGCARRWVRPRRELKLSFFVPPRSRARASLPVTLSRRAPSICQGATWPLRFRAEGVRRAR